ncbi:MAG: adenosine deaminase [Armatimonadota bacterium]
MISEEGLARRQIIQDLPKVELHVHLEGSIQPETLLQLASRYNISLPASDVAGLQEWFKFRDFNHFVEVYVAASKCIRKPEDLELIAEEFARGQAAQNVLYTEAHFTAMTIFRYAGIPFDEQLDAISRGFAKVPESPVNLILDIVRGFPVAEGEQIAQWCIDGLGKGVVGIGLSGFERTDPIAVHKHSFRAAKEAGLKCSAHAGETGGAPAIREALSDAYADRIGHGVRCIEDGQLVKELRDKQIHLEINPTSNVSLGLYPSLAEHPLPILMDEGLSVSINSDDPPFFNTTLTDEWIRCAEEFQFSTDILYSLCQGAVNKSFLGDAKKSVLRKQISESWDS